MLTKYTSLLEKLEVNYGYNVSEFINHNAYDTDYTSIITNNKENYIDIWYNSDNDYIEIFVYNIDIDNFIQTKKYKKFSSALNFITKILN